jgi:hypothetical protein
MRHLEMAVIVADKRLLHIAALCLQVQLELLEAPTSSTKLNLPPALFALALILPSR